MSRRGGWGDFHPPGFYLLTYKVLIAIIISIKAFTKLITAVMRLIISALLLLFFFLLTAHLLSDIIISKGAHFVNTFIYNF